MAADGRGAARACGGSTCAPAADRWSAPGRTGCSFLCSKFLPSTCTPCLPLLNVLKRLAGLEARQAAAAPRAAIPHGVRCLTRRMRSLPAMKLRSAASCNMYRDRGVSPAACAAAPTPPKAARAGAARRSRGARRKGGGTARALLHRSGTNSCTSNDPSGRFAARSALPCCPCAGLVALSRGPCHCRNPAFPLPVSDPGASLDTMNDLQSLYPLSGPRLRQLRPVAALSVIVAPCTTTEKVCHDHIALPGGGDGGLKHVGRRPTAAAADRPACVLGAGACSHFHPICPS